MSAPYSTSLQRRRQTAILHLGESDDGSVRYTVLYEPRVDAADPAHVPNAVEALVTNLVRVATGQGAKEE